MAAHVHELAAVGSPPSVPEGAGPEAEPSDVVVGRRVSFQFRLIAFTLVLMAVAVGISSGIAYRLKKRSLEESLGRELLAIVKSVAPFLDGDLHDQVVWKEDLSVETLPAFERLRDALLRVKAGNALLSQGSPLYTLRKPDDYVISGELEFVVMTDPDDEGRFFTGARYHVEPHLVTALGGTAAATGVYTDDEGVWISAAAPVRAADGRVVGVVQADRPVGFYYAEARSVALKIVGGAASSLTIGAALAFLLARTLTRPVRQLARATEAVASGDFTHRISEHRRDELGDLTRSFNRMADELLRSREREDEQQRAVRQAHQRTEGVNRQLAQANQELELAVDEAQRLEEEARAGELAKTEFLATMSHELRTPLNGIFGNVQLIESTPLSAEQGECLRAIQESGDRLLKTISAVLEYSQLDRGKRPRDWGNVVLEHLMLSTAASHRAAALAKGLDFTMTVAPDVPTTIRADGPALQRIVDVLLSNAVKFTRTGGVRLTIEAERGSRQRLHPDEVLSPEIDADLRVRVADTGVGVSHATRARLFLPFVQGDASTSRAHEGIGLGLAIAHKLARSAGGDLVVESRLGEGCVFTLRIPARC